MTELDKRHGAKTLLADMEKAAEITGAEAHRFLTLSKAHPEFWVEEVLDCKLWGKQREILAAVMESPRVVVRSCEASGKSFVAACAALYFIYNFSPATVITTAPTFRQVQSILWREIAQRYGMARIKLDGKLTDVKLDIEENCFAIGLSTDMPERFQGFHNQNILVIGDEASGLGEAVYRAIENPLATGNAHLLLIGNPTQGSGPFRDCFSSALYRKFHISAFDTPNFTKFGITIEDIRSGMWKEKVEKHIMPCPYLVEPAKVAERYAEWGESSFMFQVFVLGEFPEAGVNNVFRLSDIEAAMEREVKAEGDVVAGLDIARYGDDQTVYGTKQGNHYFPMISWSHAELTHTAGRVLRQVEKDKPKVLNVDVVGVGAGVVDMLKHEVKCQLTEFNAGAKAIDKERFGNRRAELYFRLQRQLEEGEIQLPKDERLKGQLADIRYRYDQKGKLWIESKEEARARGSKSPDEADTVIALLDISTKRLYNKPKVKYYFS